MPRVSFPDLPALAQHFRDDLAKKNFVLLYAYNGVGKTRLSGAYPSAPAKQAGVADITSKEWT